MALQCNTSLSTTSGLTVAAGSYIWLKEERAVDRKYSVRIRIAFFKDKASFDEGKAPFRPVLPENFFTFYQEFTPANYANLTSMTIHNYVKAQLETQIGSNTLTIVQ